MSKLRADANKKASAAWNTTDEANKRSKVLSETRQLYEQAKWDFEEAQAIAKHSEEIMNSAHTAYDNARQTVDRYRTSKMDTTDVTKTFKDKEKAYNLAQ